MFYVLFFVDPNNPDNIVITGNEKVLNMVELETYSNDECRIAHDVSNIIAGQLCANRLHKGSCMVCEIQICSNSIRLYSVFIRDM